MTRADNTRYLARAAAKRHQATLMRASDAIERLDSTGQPVTFSAVAATAGVSRAWLYRHPGIRDLISSLRSSSPATSSPAAQRATAESLKARLDAAREEITRLRTENTTLRHQLARQLGQNRAGTQASQPASNAPLTHPASRAEPCHSDMSTAQNPLSPRLPARSTSDKGLRENNPQPPGIRHSGVIWAPWL
jgi:hypothetical protein